MKVSINDFWISVKDELPPQAGDGSCSNEVLVYDKERGKDIAYYCYPTDWNEPGWETSAECIPLDEVTHWMPLPDDPVNGD